MLSSSLRVLYLKPCKNIRNRKHEVDEVLSAKPAIVAGCTRRTSLCDEDNAAFRRDEANSRHNERRIRDVRHYRDIHKTLLFRTIHNRSNILHLYRNIPV